MTNHLFVGAFVGCMLGGLLEAACFDDLLIPGFRWPIIGSSLGAIVLAANSTLIGDYELKGWVKTVSITILVGVSAGAIVGAFVISPWLTSREIGAEHLPWDKIESFHRRTGILYGGLGGATLGIAAGGVIAVRSRKTLPAASSTP